MNYNIIMFLVYLAGGFVRGTALNNLSTVTIQMYSNLTNHFDTKGQIMAFLSTCVMCGSMLGTFTATPIILKLGRKIAISIMALIYLISNIACMIPVHWIYLSVMKTLTGLSSSVIMTTVPMLFSEFVAPKQRGIFSSLINLFICFGVLLTAIVQLFIAPYDKLFFVTFIPGSVSGALLLVLTIWVKEVSTSKDLIVSEQKVQPSSIFDKKYRKCLLIALTLGPCSFIIVSSANTLAALIATPFIRRISRRKLWFSSLFGCMICQLSQIILTLINVNENILAYLKLTFTISFLISFQFGIGPLYLAILSELFPLEVKTKLMNFGMVLFWTVLITTTLLFPLIPKWTSYLIFLSIQTSCMIVLFINLPETTGKTLQEIRKIMVVEEPKVEIKPAAHAEAPLE
ncbi:Sugar_(And other) transporter family protein [Hexamita inflata]|uniref:Sugar_(And other) transporter family protein n=1 Tax=Hexamita inflata TaxID=28002 RepID=A0ABP1ISU1_9EUKA